MANPVALLLISAVTIMLLCYNSRLFVLLDMFEPVINIPGYMPIFVRHRLELNTQADSLVESTTNSVNCV